jgi:hypothetical protein
MSKFVFVCHAPITPAEATPPTPEQMNAVMQQWNAWGATVGDRMVNFGTPLAGELARTHPHLNMPGGCEIEVHQAQAIPGM